MMRLADILARVPLGVRILTALPLFGVVVGVAASHS